MTAIVIAVADLWLTGHGDSSLTRELFVWDAGGVRLSAGDLLLLVAAGAAGCAAWVLTRRAG